MEYLQVAIWLLLLGLIAGLAAATVRAARACKINLTANTTMSPSTWYQNRGPATFTRRFW